MVHTVDKAPTRIEGTRVALLRKLTATLVDSRTGAPLAGRKVVFRSLLGLTCTATTAADGSATCGGLTALGGWLTGRSTVEWAGDANHLGASAVGRC